MRNTRWKPPDNPFVRINFDAAYKTTNKMSCSGLVIRGANRRVLGFKIILDETIPSIFAAEVLTCVQGLQRRLDLGFTTMEIKGDALSVIKKAQRRDNDKLEIHAYIKDYQGFSKSFQICKFKYGERSKIE
ncbi:hypothetical protein CXB51_028178 [Gossypium anomalum]|uniref:RNase H type-1 domain-containing protein n=1 Tax=Gossypium anomalum TaxID=47600 RepID=A0A8J5YDY3_9ROSI|nr:hypothetical protein CXB51_028178 [Gossypium anomalum]